MSTASRRRLIAAMFGMAVAGTSAIATFPSLTSKRLTIDDQPEALRSRVAMIERATSDLSASPSRAAALQHLKGAALSSAEPFDLLVIGGGATGSAVALDASSRGLRVALIERADFASETSSKSTKLIHGGVRYLEKAFMGCDVKQLKLVFEALHERSTLLREAPHLCHVLPTLVPCYSYSEELFFWVGMKAYDVLAAFAGALLRPSKIVSADDALRILPGLRRVLRTEPRQSLVGGVMYYDGSMNDARLNLAAAFTAAALGATVVNHAEAVHISPVGEPGAPMCVVRVKDNIDGGAEFETRARLVVVAAGPFVDRVLQTVEQRGESKILASSVIPSAGTHITLPAYVTRSASPNEERAALLIPRTSDGRVVFVAPWNGATIAGTTDHAVAKIDAPTATMDDIRFVLASVKEAFETPVSLSDISSVWCGIRPLATGFGGSGGDTSTQSVVREHRTIVNSNGVASISGGKWTTYQKMGSDMVDALVQARVDPLITRRLSQSADTRVTTLLPLVGSPRWCDDTWYSAAAQFGRLCHRAAVSTDVEEHLWTTYGLRASAVLTEADKAEKEKLWSRVKLPGDANRKRRWWWWASDTSTDSRVVARGASDGVLDLLVPRHPILSAEVLYAARYEMCETPADFLCRRTRLAFVDAKAAMEALPKVTAIMALEGKWSAARAAAELAAARAELETFVPPAPRSSFDEACDRLAAHGGTVIDATSV